MLKCIQRLSELCDQLVAISAQEPPPGLSKDVLIDGVRSSTSRLKALTRECNELFTDEIDPKFNDAHTLTNEEDDAFFVLAQKLSSFDMHIDTGMALKIYQMLLKRARILGDNGRVLKYLYWCGITLYYNNPNRAEEILAYFEEGSDFRSEYMNMQDRGSRQYVHRCLGNRTMVLFILGEVERARRSFEYTLNFWNNLMFLGVDLDLPWTSYFLSCTNHYRQYFTKKMHNTPEQLTRNEIKSIFRISLMMNKLAQKDAAMSQTARGTRYDLMLWEAQFVSGQISMSIFCENVKNTQMSFAPDDYSANAMYANIMLPCYLMFYTKKLLPDDNASADIIKQQLEFAMRYVKALPPDINPGQISTYISLFARATSGLLPNNEHFPLVVNLTTYRHKPTFAHAITVSKLAKCIIDAYVRRYPEHFIGMLGITTAIEALEKRDEIMKLAENSGLCHDVGKLPFIRNQTMYARALTDDEIYLVRDHVKEGLTYFASDEPTDEMTAYRHVIEGHHVYYDGSDGYPKDFDISASPYRALIHTVTAADSIDSATDDIGKVYAQHITLDEVISEIKQGAGTRYSPFVAELLSDKTLNAEIGWVISRERMDAYYEAYMFANSGREGRDESNGV